LRGRLRDMSVQERGLQGDEELGHAGSFYPPDPFAIEGIEWSAVDGFLSEPPAGALPVGVTTYSSMFSHEELCEIESAADQVHENAQNGLYPDQCFHPTIGKSGALKRTKFFFGARYLWTREQQAQSDAKVAHGVRVDVPDRPPWMTVVLIEQNCITDLT